MSQTLRSVPDSLKRAPATSTGARPANRRPRFIQAMAGLLAVALGVVGAAWFAGRGDPPTAVVALSKDVGRGDVLSRLDLSRINVNVDNAIDAVPWSDVEQMIGRRSLIDLRAGTLLTPRLVADGSPIPLGMSTVGLLLEPGGYPSDAIASGDHVQIIRTPGRSDGDTTIVVSDAEVFRVAEPDSGTRSARFITLLVPAASSPAVASAGAAGEAHLIGIE